VVTQNDIDERRRLLEGPEDERKRLLGGDERKALLGQTPIELADEVIAQQGAAPPEVDLAPTGQPSLLDRAGNLAARLGTRGIEVPGVTPFLRNATNEVFQGLEAFGESTFRGLTFQDPVGSGGSLNPAEIINRQSDAFRERPLAAQLGIGLIDPGLLATRLPSAAGRVVSSANVRNQALERAARRPRATGPLETVAEIQQRPPVRPPVDEVIEDVVEEVVRPGAIPRGTTLGILKPLSSGVETTLAKMTGLIKEARPLQRSAIRAGRAAQTAERGTRIARSEALERRLINQGIPAQEANRQATSQLGGDLPVPEFAPLEMGAAEVRPLFDHISDALPVTQEQFFNRTNTRVALERVIAGELPSPSETELLRKMFGQQFVEAIRGKRALSARSGEAALDVLNAPRQIITAYDVSAPLRQGVVLGPGHPGRWSESTVTMFKALAREGAAEAVDVGIRSDRNFVRFAGRHPAGNSKNLFIADLSRGARGISGQEEQFMSRLANKIPGIRQSQRAYVTFLNKLRFDVMSDVVEGWERAGVQITDNDLDELALFINRATGRGSLGPLNDFAPILNTTFFAPRLLASRIQTPLSLISSSSLVRKQAAKDLSKFLGTGMTVLSLAALAGAAVELNPKSSDFGKIRMGNTSIEFWGGFQPLARYAAQFTFGERKIVAGKNRGEIVSVPRTDLSTFQDPIFLRFLRSKLSPAAAFGADQLLFGRENFIGEPTVGNEDFDASVSVDTDFPFLHGGIPRELESRLAPLFLQDLKEAFDDEGISGLFKALPAGFGAGSVTFPRE